MKIFLCAVTLSVMTITFVNSFGYPVPFPRKITQETPVSCVQETGATSEQVLQLYRIVPMTAIGKCLHECSMRSDGLLKRDGRIDNDKFMELLKTSLDNDTFIKIGKVMDICKDRKHPSKDKCDTVGLLLRCVTWEAEKRGFEVAYTLSLFCRFTGRC